MIVMFPAPEEATIVGFTDDLALVIIVKRTDDMDQLPYYSKLVHIIYARNTHDASLHKIRDDRSELFLIHLALHMQILL